MINPETVEAALSRADILNGKTCNAGSTMRQSESDCVVFAQALRQAQERLDLLSQNWQCWVPAKKLENAQSLIFELQKQNLDFEAKWQMEMDKTLALEAQVVRLRKSMEEYLDGDCCMKVTHEYVRLKTWAEAKKFRCGKCRYCIVIKALEAGR